MITLCESNLCTNSDTFYKGLSAAQRKVWQKTRFGTQESEGEGSSAALDIQFTLEMNFKTFKS